MVRDWSLLLSYVIDSCIPHMHIFGTVDSKASNKLSQPLARSIFLMPCVTRFWLVRGCRFSLNKTQMNSQNATTFARFAMRYFVFFTLWDTLVLSYSFWPAVYDALAWSAIFTGLFWREVEGSKDLE
jgi:hypothetical protein